MGVGLTLWRDRLLDAVTWCRFLDVYQRATGRTCTVLLYHSVAGGRGVPYFDGDVYASHMDMLRAEFHVIGADEYIGHVKSNKCLRRRSVLITFDDGFANNYTIVRPIMEQRQLPWVLFPTTQCLDEPDQPLWFVALRAICLFSPSGQVKILDREWPLGEFQDRVGTVKQIVNWVRSQSARQVFEEIRQAFETVRPHVPAEFVQNFCTMLSAEQLCELDASPLVELGGHTHSHPYLTSLQDEELHAEIDRPTERLASLLGRRIRMFAYPIGWYGSRELKRMEEMGFDCAFAVVPKLEQCPKYEIPRAGIYTSSNSVTRAKALGLVSMLRGIGVKS